MDKTSFDRAPTGEHAIARDLRRILERPDARLAELHSVVQRAFVELQFFNAQSGLGLDADPFALLDEPADALDELSDDELEAFGDVVAAVKATAFRPREA